MNCVGCGFVIQAEFAFCPKCGAPQPARCAGCGYACPRFRVLPKMRAETGATRQSIRRRPLPSPAPAAPAPPPRPWAARPAPVTVLFADLSDFTTLPNNSTRRSCRRFRTAVRRTDLGGADFGGSWMQVGDAVLRCSARRAHMRRPRARSGRRSTCSSERRAPRCGWRGAPAYRSRSISASTRAVVAGGSARAREVYSVTGDTVKPRSAAIPGGS